MNEIITQVFFFQKSHFNFLDRKIDSHLTILTVIFFKMTKRLGMISG